MPIQPATPSAATPPANVSTRLASVVNELMNPFAGNTPATPPVDPPTAWVQLAAVRRELSGAAVSLAPASSSTVTPTLALTGAAVSPAPASPSAVNPTLALTGAAVNLDPAGNPITVNPTLTFTDGIVYGNANATDANGLPLTYTIVAQPSLGGKITVIPASELTAAGMATNTFTYLPYSTVLTGSVETFSELVNQTTPLDTALEGLPLLGSLVQP
ncbi:MAG: hypothetical protein JOZ49_22545, partial [Mycolicibacterium sp.]|nr:hypothetical protein [Mycolicibacterium sp.]